MTGADATGTDFNCSYTAVGNSFDFLKIWMPYGTGLVVGVAYVVAEAGAFAADFTCS